jgi:hypothetical protein
MLVTTLQHQSQHSVMNIVTLHVIISYICYTGLCRTKFEACTRSVAQEHVEKEEGKSRVVGDHEAFQSQTSQP